MAGNLLVILSDEHQARAMGCAGHPFVKTPHLDRLAAQGTRFTKAYTPSPICVPARASLATGRPVHQTRCWDNAMPYTGETPGWGHALQAHGVPVTSIGKLHYRNDTDPTGFDRQHLPMHVAGGHGMVWGSVRREDQRGTRGGRMLGDKIGAGESTYTSYDRSVTDRTVEWLAEHAGNDQPWCLFVGLVAPHFPLVVPQAFFDLYPPEDLPPVKLHPTTGYRRHPWVEKQNALMDTEAHFASAGERLAAMSAYYGLCTWLDHNVGRILDALDTSGQADATTVLYTSDHGDNLGARGLWGKSTFYEESVAVPLIMTGPEVPQGTCDTPVSLLDVAQTIPDHFAIPFKTGNDTRSLKAMATADPDPDRAVLSEYHAVGSVSGGFMLRTGKWKLNHYVGFPPELFDLDADPEELTDLAHLPELAPVLADLQTQLRDICDPDAVNQTAFADQSGLIAKFGGPEAALTFGAPGATPPPAA